MGGAYSKFQSLTWSFLPLMSIMLLHTLQLTMGTPPVRVLYGGGSSSGPMGVTVVPVLSWVRFVYFCMFIVCLFTPSW